MKIRLHGTERECQAAAEAIARVLEVLDTSRPYADRHPSRLARVYLTAEPQDPAEGTLG